MLTFFLKIGDTSANLKYLGKILLSRISSFQIFAEKGIPISDTSLRRRVGMFLKVPFFYYEG